MSQTILNLYRNLPVEYDDKLEAECNSVERVDEAKMQFDIEQLSEDGMAGIYHVGGIRRFLLLRRWFAKGFYEVKL